MKKSYLAAGILGLSLLAIPVSSAFATDTSSAAPNCSTWNMRGATGQYPNVTFGAPPAGTSVTESSAKLVKPTDGVDPGVEFATKDIDVTLTGSVDITVHYELADGATFAAGAIRMFYYHEQNADTLNNAPANFVAADGDSGTLTIHADGQIGTLGLVYDASNNSAGSVTFTDLKVGDTPISFTKSACTSPTPTTSSVSPTPSASATTPVAPVPNPVTQTFPVTG